MTPGEIYTERYAPEYERIFISHPQWQPKMQCNLAILGALLKPMGNWLDTCCGQGWHLAQFPSHNRTGIDLNAAQLDRARRHNPGVPFIQADVADYEFPDGQCFDLVSNFWSSYSYLNDEDAIRGLVEKLVRWHFHDAGGVHRMVSPPVEFFAALIAPHFAEINHSIVVRTMRQLVARGRRSD